MTLITFISANNNLFDILLNWNLYFQYYFKIAKLEFSRRSWFKLIKKIKDCYLKVEFSIDEFNYDLVFNFYVITNDLSLSIAIMLI